MTTALESGNACKMTTALESGNAYKMTTALEFKMHVK